MKSFIKIVLLLIASLNLYSQEIMQTPDVHDIFSDKIINDEYFSKNSLTASDCENLEFIKWLFKYESGIELSDKKNFVRV